MKEVLCCEGKNNYFLFPSKFGKTLNLSMLQEFLSIRGDPTIFNTCKLGQRLVAGNKRGRQNNSLVFSLSLAEYKSFKAMKTKIQRIIKGMLEQVLIEAKAHSPHAQEEMAFTLMRDNVLEMNAHAFPPTFVEEISQIAKELLPQYDIAAIVDEFDAPYTAMAAPGFVGKENAKEFFGHRLSGPGRDKQILGIWGQHPDNLFGGPGKLFAV